MLSSMTHKPLLISSLIEHASRYHSDTEIVSVETGGGIYRSNWGQVGINARKLASALQKKGFQHGERCATMAWNNTRHLEIYFGLSGSGLVCHTLNPRLAPEQLIYIVNHAEDQIIFIDKTFLAVAAKMGSLFKTVKAFVLMGPRDEEAAAQVPDLLFYDELIETVDANYTWPEFDECEPSSLCYTSGTTGNPKGVLYTHRSTMLHALSINHPDGMALSAKDIVLPVVPMFHVNSWGVPYVAAAVGSKLVFPGPGMDGPSIASLIDNEKVTIALGVPTIWMGLLAALEASGSKAESLQRTVVGGSALPPSMITTFRDKYNVELIHAWGMTETSPLGSINSLLQKHMALPAEAQAEVRLGQGRPPWGVELRLISEDGTVLPNDGVAQGDLQIRGHWVIDTYFGTDNSALTEDGWFDTGDVSTIDANGYMVIRDRSKDIIKSGGEWISTVELENTAIAHPLVANAAVIAAFHPKWDERPVLIAVKLPDASLTEAELLAFYQDKIISWQIPDKVIFVDELPLGATGKVQKNLLREKFGQTLVEQES
jgi:acyl-CoA synthetase (AMP-forming)/AMP-acid ligase II